MLMIPNAAWSNFLILGLKFTPWMLGIMFMVATVSQRVQCLRSCLLDDECEERVQCLRSRLLSCLMMCDGVAGHGETLSTVSAWAGWLFCVLALLSL